MLLKESSLHSSTVQPYGGMQEEEEDEEAEK